MIPYLDPHPEDCACRECIPSAACEHGADCNCDLCTGAADRHVTTGHHATCDCSACHLERYGSPDDGPPDDIADDPDARAGWAAERAAYLERCAEAGYHPEPDDWNGNPSETWLTRNPG